MKRTTTPLAIVLFAFLLIPSEGAHAITVSPVSFDFEIAPGASRQDKILLINDTGERETFRLLVENFIASGEEGAQEYIHEDEPTSLASWVVVDQPAVTLDPGESAEFPYLINVPSDAEPGGHYATIFFSRGGTEGSTSGVGIMEQVGVLLLVRVPGDIREQASVESFQILNGPVLNRLPAEFNLRIRNTGSVHIRPKGTLVIRNLLGSVVARPLANPNTSAVLPNSIRKINTGWVKTVDISNGGFWTEAKNEWKNFAIGMYTVSIDSTYGSQNAALSGQEVRFWVLPWRLLLIALGMLAVLIVLIKGYNALLVQAALRKSRRKDFRNRA